MERPIMKPIGTPAEDLDTPSLVVDLDILESNIANFSRRFVDNNGPRLRSHLASHLSPAIAHMQRGERVAVSTLGQAEAFAQHGFRFILISNLAVTKSKIARVAALARRTTLKIGVESERNIADMGAAATSVGSEVGAVVVVQDPSRFIGVPPHDAARLAQLIHNTPGLRFGGLMSSSVEPLLEAASDCSDYLVPDPLYDRLGAPIVSLTLPGEQETLTVLKLSEDPEIPVDIRPTRELSPMPYHPYPSPITEIIAGSYALMDAANLGPMPELRPAARILTTVMTHQDQGLVWLDAGQKATSIDTGLPQVDGIPGASVSRMSAEHGGMVLEEGASWDIDLGSKVWLIPHNIANTVNVYDYIHATRDGKLEAVWEVAARGRYD